MCLCMFDTVKKHVMAKNSHLSKFVKIRYQEWKYFEQSRELEQSLKIVYKLYRRKGKINHTIFQNTRI